MNPTTLNNLIPMEDPEGNRTFVNSWDVPTRKTEGWKVIGDLAKHTSQVKAPTELLDGNGKTTQPSAATPGDAVAGERLRVRAILRAADDEQSELADKLIADGKPEAESLQALAADRDRRKALPAPKVKAGKAAAPVDGPATPPQA